MHRMLSLNEKANLLYNKIEDRDQISFRETIDFLMDSRDKLEEAVIINDKPYSDKGILLDFNSFETHLMPSFEQEIYLLPSKREYLAIGKVIDSLARTPQLKNLSPEETRSVVDPLRLVDLVVKYLELESSGMPFSQFYRNPMSHK